VPGATGIGDELVVSITGERPDKEIAEDVAGRLREDSVLSRYGLEADVNAGRVKLSGAVGSLAERQRAEARAWVKGVRAVDVTNIEIKGTARAPMLRAELPQPDPVQVREAVMAAINKDPRVAARKLGMEVHVSDGIVTLSGIVRTMQARQAAEEDAKNTVGVRMVKNHLRVRPRKPVTAQQLRERVLSRLAREPLFKQGKINVQVANGQVYLRGEVPTLLLKRFIGHAVADVPGVEAVANNILVRPDRDQLSDEELKQRTRLAMFWSPFVDRDDISVEVEEGQVTLEGEVETWRERNAAYIAAIEAGAVQVRNRIALASWKKSRP
jgi:osmotically-inducible protein OsmY